MRIPLNRGEGTGILVRPAPEHAEEIRAFRRELLESGSAADGTGGLPGFEDPLEYIEYCARAEMRETQMPGLVPASQFLYMNGDDGRIIGMIQVRHELNDVLAKLGGHIGYCVRPSCRGRKEAAKMLKLALEYCDEALYLPWVMISCRRDNPASEHTILACRGKRDRIVIDPETGKEACIYIITRAGKNYE